MRKLFNFNAGPAMLPEEVLKEAQQEILDWHGTGMSIMELGHRANEFSSIAEQSEADLRELMKIPANYHVLFLAGGASPHFAMVPLNLLGNKKKADYIDTGIWSKKAIAEAQRYGEVNVAARSILQDGLNYVPHQEEWQVSHEAAYLHYTPNETIEGIEIKWVPQLKNIPLVADMSSIILARPFEVSQFGLIYAGAQKNIGQAGLSIAIIRDDLAQEALPFTPTLYKYKLQAENHSFYNTPPTYAWYIAGLVFAWMKQKGGVSTFYEMNKRKSTKLYQFIDQHNGFYQNRVHPENRSMMNVTIDLSNDELTQLFLKESAANGLANLKGHRTVGGVRASIYNAMPEKGVDALIEFMAHFIKKYG